MEMSGSPESPLLVFTPSPSTPSPPLAGAPLGAVLSPVWLSVAGGRVGGGLEMQGESWEEPRGDWGMATTHHPPATLSVFWVQVLLAGLVVPLLLGATLTYTYRRCRPCKPKFPDKAGTEALTSLQATHVSPSDSAHTFLAPPSSSEKVCTVQLVGNSWTSGPPQTQEAPCPEVTWSWDQLPSRALGKGFQWPEALAPFSQVKVRSCGFLKHHLPTSYPLTDQANLPARLGPAPAPAPPRVPHWLSPAARRPAAASAHAPCRLGGHHAPARPTTLRRDGRGARAALEGVRAHAGAARGGDRGGGGGGRPLPRPAIRDAQALAPATARGLGRRLRGSGAHGPGRLRRGPAESLAAGPVMLETTPTPRLWWPLQKP
ncbi:tumor necrosis factor receptor superfamily member 25 isoform X5 [Camelus bactrianus]|uniref:Tumor necrosis factor receptor superfamily member 25 isoform X5 n=1 Tax=Camelus bactrianus TaxID=9837 RepID=A0AC58RGJ8_CAMBA